MKSLLLKWFGIKECNHPICEHCDGGFIPYNELLAVVKRNFPNTFDGLVKTRKGETK